MAEQPSADDPDRHNGMLTTANREFLLSDGSGYSYQNQNHHREQIKKRVENTILDFTLLWEHWEESEREEVFGPDPAADDFGEGLADMVALLYSEAFLGGRFKNLLLRGVNKAEAELAESDDNLIASVDFEVNHIGTTEYETAIEKFGRGKLKDMTDGESRAILNLFRRSRTVNRNDLQEMKGDIVDRIDEMMDKHYEDRHNKANNAREKQGRLMNDDE